MTIRQAVPADAAAVGALAEFFEKKIRIDDNFGIPFFSGWAAVLLLHLLG